MNINDKQQIVEKVVANLYEQNEYAIDKNKGCLYRKKTIDGKILKCAVGGLIPDEVYSDEFEEKIAGALPVFILQACGLYEGDDSSIYNSFGTMIQQELHDNPARSFSRIGLRSTSYRRLVARFCERNGLSSDFLSKYVWEEFIMKK